MPAVRNGLQHVKMSAFAVQMSHGDEHARSLVNLEVAGVGIELAQGVGDVTVWIRIAVYRQHLPDHRAYTSQWTVGDSLVTYRYCSNEFHLI